VHARTHSLSLSLSLSYKIGIAGFTSTNNISVWDLLVTCTSRFNTSFFKKMINQENKENKRWI
jgi:hypothetical protein